MSGAAAADSAGAERSCEAAAAVAAAAAESSAAIDAEKRLPATAASDAPAKKTIVKTKVVASRRLRDLGLPDWSSAGSALPKSQLSLRVNHRGIAVCSF